MSRTTAEVIGVQFGPMTPEQREAVYSSRAEKIVLPKREALRIWDRELVSAIYYWIETHRQSSEPSGNAQSPVHSVSADQKTATQREPTGRRGSEANSEHPPATKESK